MKFTKRLPSLTDVSIGKFSVLFFFSLLVYSLATFFLSILSLHLMNPATSQEEIALSTEDLDMNPLAGLSCDAYGGPTEDVAKEMVYWQDIPSDRYVLSFC